MNLTGKNRLGAKVDLNQSKTVSQMDVSFEVSIASYTAYTLPMTPIYPRELQHTPGNPPSQLWKESLYSPLVKV